MRRNTSYIKVVSIFILLTILLISFIFIIINETGNFALETEKLQMNKISIPLDGSGKSLTYSIVPSNIGVVSTLHDNCEIRGSWSICDIDASGAVGFENAIYAPNENEIFIAYKEFTGDLSDYIYNPARLKIAHSRDGGETWDIKILDEDAAESYTFKEKSISIGGDGNVIYVAYLSVYNNQNGNWNRLKVAKSDDFGDTWSTKVVEAYRPTRGEAVGDIAIIGGSDNSIEVFSKDHALITFSGKPSNTAYGYPGLFKVETTDGGTTWYDKRVDGFYQSGKQSNVDSIDSSNIYSSEYLSYRCCLNYISLTRTDLWFLRSDNGGTTWTFYPVEQHLNQDIFVGFQSALARDGETFYSAYAYYDDRTVPIDSRFKISRSIDGGKTWNVVKSWSSKGGSSYTGGTPAINVLQGHIDVTYIDGDGSESYWTGVVGCTGTNINCIKHSIKWAHSTDGLNWVDEDVPEDSNVLIYQDMVVPSPRVMYISYAADETVYASGSGIVRTNLKIARLNR